MNNKSDEEFKSDIKSDSKNKMKGFDSFGHKEPKTIITTDNEASNIEKKSIDGIRKDLSKKEYHTYTLKPKKVNSHLRNRKKELKVTNMKISNYKSNINIQKPS